DRGGSAAGAGRAIGGWYLSGRWWGGRRRGLCGIPPWRGLWRERASPSRTGHCDGGRARPGRRGLLPLFCSGPDRWAGLLCGRRSIRASRVGFVWRSWELRADGSLRTGMSALQGGADAGDAGGETGFGLAAVGDDAAGVSDAAAIFMKEAGDVAMGKG